jgi:hypothetical protein
MSDAIVCGARTAPKPSQAPIAPAPANIPTTPRPRGQPQAILSAFQDAMEKATRVCQLARGREVGSIKACVAKLVSAERQRALHILAAADMALAELEG